MGSVPFGDFVVFRGFGGGLDFGGGGGGFGPSSLILDGERGELVKAPVRIGRKGIGGVSEVRAALALKSHSEAERRRRERINSHLSTLRSLVPTANKMDKAALLAEVIKQVRELKRNATEAGKFCSNIIPSDEDGIDVETCHHHHHHHHHQDEMNGEKFSLKVSLSCDDRPELLTDLKHATRSLRLKTVSADISTLGGRTKVVLVMRSEERIDEMEKQLVTSSVRQALTSVVHRTDVSQTQKSSSTVSSTLVSAGKRRRISQFESSSSSS